MLPHRKRPEQRPYQPVNVTLRMRDPVWNLRSQLRALSIRIARGPNAMMGRRGPVLEDRHHAHVLGTPAEARNAVRYAVGNFASHAARRGERAPMWLLRSVERERG